eukprot:2608920-Rhodomonas_salina.1
MSFFLFLRGLVAVAPDISPGSGGARSRYRKWRRARAVGTGHGVGHAQDDTSAAMAASTSTAAAAAPPCSSCDAEYARLAPDVGQDQQKARGVAGSTREVLRSVCVISGVGRTGTRTARKGGKHRAESIERSGEGRARGEGGSNGEGGRATREKGARQKDMAQFEAQNDTDMYADKGPAFRPREPMESAQGGGEDRATGGEGGR